MLGPKVGCGSDRELETSEKNVCFRHVDAKSCQAASGQKRPFCCAPISVIKAIFVVP